VTPSDLPVVFVEILKMKLRLSLSELDGETQEELSHALLAIQEVLLKDGVDRDGRILEKAREKILTSTIYLQNRMIAIGTLGNGTVKVTSGIYESAKKMLCLWPYC
jgi:hypothetical protein